MALANAIVGARHTPQTITWTDADGNAQDLTNATLTGVIRNQRSGVSRLITGTLTPSPTVPEDGEFEWEYSAADVETVGDYDVQFSATYPDDTFFDATYVTTWSVKELLEVPN